MSEASVLFLSMTLLLLLGGGALIATARPASRNAVSKRLALIAPEPDIALVKAPLGPPSGDALLPASRGPVSADQRELLAVAGRLGLSAGGAQAVFVALRVALALAAGGAGLAVGARMAGGHGALIPMVAALALAFVGWIAPAQVLKGRAKARAKAVTDGLPEALELLVVCVEAGLSLEDGIDRIIGELTWSQPALAQELALTAADLKILSDRNQALANLATRVNTPSVRSVVTSLSQTLTYGTPLAQALRVTAAELRNDALVQMEERANRLPPLLTVPMMLFIMPTIFLVIGGPAFLKLMDTFLK